MANAAREMEKAVAGGVGQRRTLRGKMLSPLATGIYEGLGAVGAVGLAAGGYAYASLWPGSRIFGSALIAPKRAGKLALTFDDGPNPKWTPRLLDVLGEHGVKATFFMLGSTGGGGAGAGAAGCGGGAPDRESLMEPSESGADGDEQSAGGVGADERDAGTDYGGTDEGIFGRRSGRGGRWCSGLRGSWGCGW